MSGSTRAICWAPSRIYEPTNIQRAQWAKAALTVFTKQTHSGEQPDTMHPGDLEDAVADLICDLLHFAQFHPTMDPVFHARAFRLLQEETAVEESCDCSERSWYGPYYDTARPVSAETQEAPDLANLREVLQLCEESAFPFCPPRRRHSIG